MAGRRGTGEGQGEDALVGNQARRCGSSYTLHIMAARVREREGEGEREKEREGEGEGERERRHEESSAERERA